MPGLLLLALPQLALAQDAFVVLPGLGPVTLQDATNTCVEGQPTGSVAEALTRSPAREPAFQAVARALLTQSEEDRKAYWRYNFGAVWPEKEIDATYVPTLDWVPAGVVPSCFAAGAWYAGVGLRTADACQGGRATCKDVWPPDDWDRVKDIDVVKELPADGRDPFFLALHAFPEPRLISYVNPMPFLVAACDAPGTAARQSRLLDDNDLLAARRACLQQLVLVQRTRLADLALPCNTPWSAIAADDPHVWSGPHSDLGLTDRYRTEQIDTLRDRLQRMDPSIATCEAPWAANWRKEQLKVWREGQTARACGDENLSLPDRARFCPTLYESQAASCDGGDAAACGRVASLLVSGTQVAADERLGTQKHLTACTGGVAPSCAELRNHASIITGFVSASLDRAKPLEAPAEGEPAAPWPPPDALRVGKAILPGDAGKRLLEARGLIDSYGAHLDPAWLRGQASLLFDAAIVAGDAGVGEGVLKDFVKALDPEWAAAATLRHQELISRMQREALDALGGR